MRPQAGTSDSAGAGGLTKSQERLCVLTESLVEWTRVGLLDNLLAWGGGAWLSPGGAQRHINTHTAGGKNKTQVTPVGLPVIPHQDLIGNILSLKINFPLCFI